VRYSCKVSHFTPDLSTDIVYNIYDLFYLQACYQAGISMSMPPPAVLAGLLLIVSFAMSVVEVEGTNAALDFDLHAH